MTPRLTAIVMGIVLLLAAVLAACDRDRLHAGHLKHRHALAHVQHALDEVDASDDQKARVRTILSKAVTDLEPWPTIAERLRADLAAAWRSDTPDRDELHRRVDHEIDSLRTLTHALVDDGLELHAVLTSEQRRQLLRATRRH